ncbi:MULTISPECIES: response regulator [Azospira]|jgi:DNA-binding NarL/FixJ family response regulator|uniref:Response regulator containing a CheY-like receiver domain and an HTH DNA-binding domain n=1 Tax=Azospira oryzae (strain ATCC BAA-33 / DSM 13638 / PS) TaxID=640081 RepID=G8QL84_AZOOP|nr:MULTISPECIES: response regulator transcription factor [Azospira]AEV27798.1 response regulator containing a CheY-like receiver domain and an HTH DNA-binding domain [Azospira oryzae PS]MBP7489808.1 response regulator transcription factor [Azospira sp.]TLS17667.1 MAG: response regulator transcription factor [Betaproteobacteria bacterium]BBN88514.1 DNA-binding response regulator [Azospira sp. I09]
MIRILLADDHSIVRSGLKQLLATEADLEVAGEASQGSEVLTRLRQGGIDLLLMDMSMPGISGLDLIRRAHTEAPEVPVVVLSMHNESQLVSRALRAGASGYVTKDSDPAILLAAIRKVARGGRFIDPALVDAMVFGAPEEAPPHEALSDREFEVLQLLSQGLALAAVGERLHVSAKTVSTHKTRLMQKLGIDNNAELVRYALRHGLGRP